MSDFWILKVPIKNITQLKKKKRILLSFKEEGSSDTCYNADDSQSRKDKYCSVPLIGGI